MMDSNLVSQSDDLNFLVDHWYQVVSLMGQFQAMFFSSAPPLLDSPYPQQLWKLIVLDLQYF